MLCCRGARKSASISSVLCPSCENTTARLAAMKLRPSRAQGLAIASVRRPGARVEPAHQKLRAHARSSSTTGWNGSQAAISSLLTPSGPRPGRELVLLGERLAQVGVGDEVELDRRLAEAPAELALALEHLLGVGGGELALVHQDGADVAVRARDARRLPSAERCQSVWLAWWSPSPGMGKGTGGARGSAPAAAGRPWAATRAGRATARRGATRGRSASARGGRAFRARRRCRRRASGRAPPTGRRSGRASGAPASSGSIAGASSITLVCFALARSWRSCSAPSTAS